MTTLQANAVIPKIVISRTSWPQRKTSKTLYSCKCWRISFKFGTGFGTCEGMSWEEFGKSPTCYSRCLPGAHFRWKMTMLHVDHHDGHNVGPIVFLLGRNIAKYKDIPYGGRSADIEQNSKWLPWGFFLLIFHRKNDIFASLSQSWLQNKSYCLHIQGACC